MGKSQSAHGGSCIVVAAVDSGDEIEVGTGGITVPVGQVPAVIIVVDGKFTTGSTAVVDATVLSVISVVLVVCALAGNGAGLGWP
ncbi:hypothetical protein V7S43_007409 [Phytophthora oleae]|uniref:Pectate lyase n=1 Tax=Phytophthora oleae TaxID=2107226 RepID=A0ABD3FNH3_9STRA